MPHICTTCLKKFENRGHLTIHMNRKVPCARSPEIEAIIRSEIQVQVEDALCRFKTDMVEGRLASLAQVKEEDLRISDEHMYNWSQSMLGMAEIEKPCLSWISTKTPIINTVIEMFPRDMESYHEPFVGGGSVLLGLLAHKNAGNIKIRGEIRASDSNINLIYMYKNIQTNVEALIKILSEIEGEHANLVPVESEINYYIMRNLYNEYYKKEFMSPQVSALFIFLNKTCMKGFYREGKDGFNVPYGHSRKATIFSAGNLRRLSVLLKDVIFTHEPYKLALERSKKGDFIYMNPPHIQSQRESERFVSFMDTPLCQSEYADLFHEISTFREKGITCVLSNSEAKLVFDTFTEPTYTVKRIDRRGPSYKKNPLYPEGEVLVRN